MTTNTRAPPRPSSRANRTCWCAAAARRETRRPRAACRAGSRPSPLAMRRASRGMSTAGLARHTVTSGTADAHAHRPRPARFAPLSRGCKRGAIIGGIRCGRRFIAPPLSPTSRVTLLPVMPARCSRPCVWLDDADALDLVGSGTCMTFTLAGAREQGEFDLLVVLRVDLAEVGRVRHLRHFVEHRGREAAAEDDDCGRRSGAAPGRRSSAHPAPAGSGRPRRLPFRRAPARSTPNGRLDLARSVVRPTFRPPRGIVTRPTRSWGASGR